MSALQHVPTDRRANGGPTVLRILLGGHLRRMRAARGLSREVAGEAIRASGSKISRLELGRVGFKKRDVDDLLTLYGVSDAGERRTLLDLADRANEPGWWHRYGDILPPWCEAYIGLEEAASALRVHETRLVPELLQTEDYARAAISLTVPGASTTEIERRVSLLMGRQGILRRPPAPQLWAVVDEAALRRPVGGPAVMRAQLASLLATDAIVQIVPPSFGPAAAATGPFTLLRFAEAELPDIVYLEQLTGALYLDKPADLDAYKAALDRLSMVAGPPSATRQTLTEIMDGDPWP